MDREINKETRVIDRSTMKRSEYITWHLFYIIVALVLANGLLFVTLPRLSAIQSRLILVFIIILISLVLSIPRWKRNRTQIAVIEDVIIGLGMYIITAYWRFYKNWFTIIIIIVSFIIFTVSVCVWLPKYRGQHIFNIENRCTKKRVVKSRFLRMSNLTSLIITVCMLILSGPIIYNKLFYGGIKASTINNDYVVDRGDNSRHLDEYKDELKILFYEDLWKDASVNERLNVAQILADCEVNKLGMSKIKVIISEMPTDDYLSGYDEASKTMYINKEFLLSSSSSDLYTIILHEAYHEYEYRLLDLYTKASPDEKKLEVFLYCDAYLEEFSDYIDDADADYYHQLCEMMARAYARREFENAWNELEEAVHKAVA